MRTLKRYVFVTNALPFIAAGLMKVMYGSGEGHLAYGYGHIQDIYIDTIKTVLGTSHYKIEYHKPYEHTIVCNIFMRRLRTSFRYDLLDISVLRRADRVLYYYKLYKHSRNVIVKHEVLFRADFAYLIKRMNDEVLYNCESCLMWQI